MTAPLMCSDAVTLYLVHRAVARDVRRGIRPERHERCLRAATWEHALNCRHCRPEIEGWCEISLEEARARVERYRKRRLCEVGGRIRSAMREADDPARPPDQWFRLSKYLFRHVLDCRPCLAAFESDGVTADRIRELELDLGDGEGWKP